MKSINALIIDDEEHNRNVLSTLLNKYCPIIKITGEAESADEAYNLITIHKPELIFLDVRMPEKSGFDLLKKFEAFDFEVIFVSAFNEYAVTAFDFNALGYIMKPIDYNKLINSVNKAILKIGLNSQNTGVLQFIKTLEPTTDSIIKIAIHHNEKVVLVNIADIISIHADLSICHVKLIDNQHYHSSKDLKLFEGMFKEFGNFIRISKNTIINLDHLKSYQKGEVCMLQMKNGFEFEVSRRKKTEVLNKIKLL